MKNGLFLFPDLQENTDTSVVLEFMKIKLSDLCYYVNEVKQNSFTGNEFEHVKPSINLSESPLVKTWVHFIGKVQFFRKTF